MFKDKKNLVFFFLCVFTSSKFIFSCLLKVHCVEGFIMTLYVPSMQYNKNWKNSHPPKNAQLTISVDTFIGGRMEQSTTVDTDLFFINVHLLILCSS